MNLPEQRPSKGPSDLTILVTLTLRVFARPRAAEKRDMEKVIVKKVWLLIIIALRQSSCLDYTLNLRRQNRIFTLGKNFEIECCM